MTNNKQQTAFGFFLEQSILLDLKRDNCSHTEFTHDEYLMAKIELRIKVWEMQKKQIINAHGDEQSKLQDDGTWKVQTGEQYYNETYGGDNK